MIAIKPQLTLKDLEPKLKRLWELSRQKILLIEEKVDMKRGAPVFTVNGQYTARGWTEWTEGFIYGAAILQYDATGDKECLEIGRKHTLKRMASHVSHIGVHDHGFNNVSTYGNLRRLMVEGKLEGEAYEKHFYELGLKVSGAVQAARWTALPEGKGFIHSFNGPHSLFVDTIRSLRSLMVSHQLGHVLMGEGDRKISLLARALEHIRATAHYSVYYGEGRDFYDLRGRTTHEAIFNTNDGAFRCPSTQQGYSNMSTWTRGLSWAMVGFPEQLECLDALPDEDFATLGGKDFWKDICLKAAKATNDFFIEHTPVDGIPYWDTGAPGLAHMGDYLSRPAEPWNDFEPVDSSAAAIGAQGLLRLGRYLRQNGSEEEGNRYWQAGLTVLDRLLDDTYLSLKDDHQGLLLHSVYHRPNGWDNIPEGQKVPCDESCMWGDYHLRETALLVQRMLNQESYYHFYL